MVFQKDEVANALRNRERSTDNERRSHKRSSEESKGGTQPKQKRVLHQDSDSSDRGQDVDLPPRSVAAPAARTLRNESVLNSTRLLQNFHAPGAFGVSLDNFFDAKRVAFASTSGRTVKQRILQCELSKQEKLVECHLLAEKTYAPSAKLNAGVPEEIVERTMPLRD
ncbi:hypothetical protein PHYPSEUDO_009546 [Phytophthora pseudosyringae]|uniref:Uncharacterized protein n=1 Tax=Phytophthora pseudosyringae TaxID=221518 RepID=A0A8T1WGS7_9STRA|nr:hypothetical protein PHYPSEUDO_009546 [Phytophthora pseudosyringae]